MNFEDNLAKLEALVSEMESGRLGLDELMKDFEEGRKLADSCAKELEVVRQKIEKLVVPPAEPPQVEPLSIV